MRLNNSRKKKRHLILLALPLLLSACFGKDDDISPQTNPAPLPPAPLASDGTSRVVISHQNSHAVSLATFIPEQKNTKLSLTAVKSLSEPCPESTILNPHEMTYQLTGVNSPQTCVYRFKVENTASNGTTASVEADNYVRITDNINDNLAVLSLPHFNYRFKENGPFEIPLMEELEKLKVPLAGKTLNSNIIVLGLGFAMKQSESHILFAPEPNSTMSRLVYTLIDDNNPPNIESGSIDLFIEQSNNTFPNAWNFTYSPLGIVGEEITGIDVAGNISDVDGDALKLVSVSSLDALVSLQNPSSCNTCFNFKAHQQGLFKVNYVISDQHQGYASAIVTINVDKPWKNISNPTNLKAYTATPSEFEAKKIPLIISSFADYPGTLGIKVPRLSYGVANEFCRKQGRRLPLERELNTLYNENGGSLQLTHNWPVKTPYWISSNTEQEAISLENGQLLFPLQDAFVTCATPDIIDIIVSPIEGEIHTKETLQFYAKEQNDTGLNVDITEPVLWESSKPYVASVNSKGLVTALSSGNTMISAKYRGITSVTSPVLKVYELSDIAITPSIIAPQSLNSTHQLTAKSVYTNNITPGKEPEITWRSDAPTIVSIDATGLITTLKTGTANIYAVMDNFESLHPLAVNVLNQSKIIGNSGKSAVSISTTMYPAIEVRSSSTMIVGFYSADTTNLTLLAGGKEGSTLTKWSLTEIKSVSVYTVTENGIESIAKITWEGQNGQINTIGVDNQNATLAGTITITDPLKSMSAYWSETTLGKGVITGLAFHYI